MAARVIDGKAIAAGVRERVRDEVERRRSAGEEPPGLATVLVGDDPASHTYVAGKHRASAEVGINSIRHDLPADTTQDVLVELVGELNSDPQVQGILVQLPLPPHIEAAAVIAAIDPLKDVDGLTAVNAGLLALGRDGLFPATPSGVMALLDSEHVALEGAEAVVVGRSDLVGKPVAALLLRANATVTVCHSRTRDLGAACRRADVLVAAVGMPRLITAGMVKPGATVIDVGMNRTDEGLAGDVDFESVAAIAGAITPVPGGVGPMTIAMLLENTLKAASLQASERAGRTLTAGG